MFLRYGLRHVISAFLMVILSCDVYAMDRLQEGGRNVAATEITLATLADVQQLEAGIEDLKEEIGSIKIEGTL